MATRVTGVDIASTCVRAAEIAYGRDHFVLHRFAQIPLPVGAVVRGEVVDAQAVATATRLLWRQGRFRSKSVSIAAAGPRAVVRDARIAHIPAGSRRRRLAEIVDPALVPADDEQVMDFVALQTVQEPGGPAELEGLLVAAPTAAVAAAVSAVEAAGLEVTDVDLAPFAVVRCIAEADPVGINTRLEAVVDVGGATTDVVVHRNAVPLGVRTIPTGGQDITARLMAELGVDLPTAESLKREAVAEAAAPPPGSPQAVIAAAVADSVAQIVVALQQILADAALDPPTRISLTGGGSLIAGLAVRLQRLTGRPVERGHSLLRMGAGRSGLSHDHMLFADPLAATAIGLAIRSG